MNAIAIKAYHDNNIYVNVEIDGRRRVIKFVSEKEMKRFGECLLELVRIGGNTVEIKDKKEKE